MTALTEALALATNFTNADVIRAMSRAPVRYKEYRIRKRNGDWRPVSQPAREVKLLQRALVTLLLSKLPVHDSATAYRTGVGIEENARRHSGTGPILKMDFKQFFPSITAKDWARYCRDNGCLADPVDIELTSRLLFRRRPRTTVLRLAIGAPSSPVLSNVLLYDFDVAVSEAVAKDKVTYTRYADDLTFSAARTGNLNGVEKAVRKVLKGLIYPRLTVNEDKTTYATRKYRRSVTGLVLANQGQVTIGRSRKRLISAAVNRARNGLLDFDQLRSLCGTLAFVNAVEPDFLDRLRARYGVETISAVQRALHKGKVQPHHTLLEWQSASWEAQSPGDEGPGEGR